MRVYQFRHVGTAKLLFYANILGFAFARSTFISLVPGLHVSLRFSLVPLRKRPRL
jgi:hypothetical protein